jgi:hypothetical protein
MRPISTSLLSDLHPSNPPFLHTDNPRKLRLFTCPLCMQIIWKSLTLHNSKLPSLLTPSCGHLEIGCMLLFTMPIKHNNRVLHSPEVVSARPPVRTSNGD